MSLDVCLLCEDYSLHNVCRHEQVFSDRDAPLAEEYEAQLQQAKWDAQKLGDWPFLMHRCVATKLGVLPDALTLLRAVNDMDVESVRLTLTAAGPDARYVVQSWGRCPLRAMLSDIENSHSVVCPDYDDNHPVYVMQRMLQQD